MLSVLYYGINVNSLIFTRIFCASIRYLMSIFVSSLKLVRHNVMLRYLSCAIQFDLLLYIPRDEFP